MAQAADLHPFTRAGMGFHLWSLAGLGQHGDRMEAAVTAARIVTSEGKGAVLHTYSAADDPPSREIRGSRNPNKTKQEEQFIKNYLEHLQIQVDMLFPKI